jgi:hypothetical protein
MIVGAFIETQKALAILELNATYMAGYGSKAGASWISGRTAPKEVKRVVH